ncbi:hypothetical protein B484DRAFT_458008, partial [Ochromonadaceae sp. CCMP2298]
MCSNESPGAISGPWPSPAQPPCTPLHPPTQSTDPTAQTCPVPRAPDLSPPTLCCHAESDSDSSLSDTDSRSAMDTPPL